jgi:hypothetical protein
MATPLMDDSIAGHEQIAKPQYYRRSVRCKLFSFAHFRELGKNGLLSRSFNVRNAITGFAQVDDALNRETTIQIERRMGQAIVRASCHSF